MHAEHGSGKNPGSAFRVVPGPPEKENGQRCLLPEILHVRQQDTIAANIVTIGQQRFRVLEVVREQQSFAW